MIVVVPGGGMALASQGARAGELTLDADRLAADTGRGPVPLTRLEFLLLKELASHDGRPVGRATLLATVWGFDFNPGSNVVDVCVWRLRSKLGFGLIKTVRGEGYQLAAGSPGSATASRTTGQRTSMGLRAERTAHGSQ